MRPARNWLLALTCARHHVLLIILSSIFIYFTLPHQIFNQSNRYLSTIDDQFSLINQTNSIERNRTVRLAVVSAIYNNDYMEAVQVLAYSLRRVHIQADLILLFISNRLNQSTLNRCQEAGWHLWAVDRIDPPRFAIIYPRFRDQYTKLRIWSLINYDRVLYLDADTLVVRDINELFTGTIFEDDQDGLLAAVEDVWQGQIGPNFNAGVLLIRPNQTIFEDMLVKMHNMAAYGSYWAEQGFLNWYFKGRYEKKLEREFIDRLTSFSVRDVCH